MHRWESAGFRTDGKFASLGNDWADTAIPGVAVPLAAGEAGSETGRWPLVLGGCKKLALGVSACIGVEDISRESGM